MVFKADAMPEEKVKRKKIRRGMIVFNVSF